MRQERGGGGGGVEWIEGVSEGGSGVWVEGM